MSFASHYDYTMETPYFSSAFAESHDNFISNYASINSAYFMVSDCCGISSGRINAKNIIINADGDLVVNLDWVRFSGMFYFVNTEDYDAINNSSSYKEADKYIQSHDLHAVKFSDEPIQNHLRELMYVYGEHYHVDLAI
jgi:hypothetical protein